MREADATLIDLTEAVYDIDQEDAAWIPNLLRVGLPILDHGLGVGAAAYTRDPERPDLIVHQKFAVSGRPDLIARVNEAVAEWPRDVYRELMRPGVVSTLSEAARNHPECLEAYERHVPGVRDVFGMTSVDPNGLGILIVAPLPERTQLRGRNKELWQMMGAHVAAGHRLRRAVTAEVESTGLPHDAEAVIDPKRFDIVEATAGAEPREAASVLREAAIQVDRARASEGRKDPAFALEVWKGLTEGRWSLVDWFDSDSRRFVLALPNTPEVGDPRGLTTRENLVATYAMHGDSQKLIGYRLGLSKASVSRHLKSAMRKLNVKTHAQLIEKMGVFAG
ncbi:MAG: helix-turn-helix transcriptional regulator [Myxococcota bacterium]